MRRIAASWIAVVVVGLCAVAGSAARTQPASVGPSVTPSDGAVDLSLTNTELRWPAVPGAVSYDVYFGTTPQPRLRATQAGTTFAAGVLETATTYYWRVDTTTPAGRVAGQTRTFMTAGAMRFLLVGDSTVTDDIGWGRGFLHRLTSRSTVTNAAKNGRSSKSYRDEGSWREALASPADYILIQFGHNDMPGKGPERETDPSTTYRQNLARYIDEARVAGARPIVVTSLTRRQFGPDGKVASDLGAYVEAAKAVGADRRATVIDLHALSIVVLDRMGSDAAAELGIVKEDGTLDRTHLSPRGSDLFGAIVADELRRLVPELGPFIRPPAGEALPLRSDSRPSSSAVGWTRILDQPDAWYGSAEAVAIAGNVLLFQRSSGGWPKNTDMARRFESFEAAEIEAAKADADSTIDNNSTTTQLRFLARVHTAAPADRFRAAFVAGLDYLFAAQYPNGGWPQFYPLRTDYSRHITFNDNAMTNVLNLLRDVASGRMPMAFVDEARRTRAKAAYEKGVSVILAAQIAVKGRLTAWCAQVDAVTLEPRQARTYEHPSISGSESVGIVKFLMSIERPSPAVITAVEAAVAWFRDVKLTGTRVVARPDAGVPGGVDRVVVQDPAAPPVWARFYEIGTNRPIFSGRDGVVRYSLSEIEPERRLNYSWLGPYATDLLASDYPAWKARVGSARRSSN
jgi:PelA/Pel-15E family pectate lyase